MIPSTVRIFVCSEPQDMRRSFDGLALAAQEHLGEDPQSGALFVFVNKRRNRVKVLWFDRNGYCLLYKRLHRARFELPLSRTIDARALAQLLHGVPTRRGRAISS
jgi:transposase